MAELGGAARRASALVTEEIEALKQAERQAEETRHDALESARRVLERVDARDGPLAQLALTLRDEVDRVSAGSPPEPEDADREPVRVPGGPTASTPHDEHRHERSSPSTEHPPSTGQRATAGDPATLTPEPAAERRGIFRGLEGRDLLRRLNPWSDGARGVFITTQGNCAVCQRSLMAGSEENLRNSGWQVSGDVGLCPDCQNERWQLPEGARLPFRPGGGRDAPTQYGNRRGPVLVPSGRRPEVEDLPERSEQLGRQRARFARPPQRTGEVGEEGEVSVEPHALRLSPRTGPWQEWVDPVHAFCSSAVGPAHVEGAVEQAFRTVRRLLRGRPVPDQHLEPALLRGCRLACADIVRAETTDRTDDRFDCALTAPLLAGSPDVPASMEIQARFEQHLQHCERCQATRQRFDEAAQAFASAPAGAAPQELRSRLHEEMGGDPLVEDRVEQGSEPLDRAPEVPEQADQAEQAAESPEQVEEAEQTEETEEAEEAPEQTADPLEGAAVPPRRAVEHGEPPPAPPAPEPPPPGGGEPPSAATAAAESDWLPEGHGSRPPGARREPPAADWLPPGWQSGEQSGPADPPPAEPETATAGQRAGSEEDGPGPGPETEPGEVADPPQAPAEPGTGDPHPPQEAAETEPERYRSVPESFPGPGENGEGDVQEGEPEADVAPGGPMAGLGRRGFPVRRVLLFSLGALVIAAVAAVAFLIADGGREPRGSKTTARPSSVPAPRRAEPAAPPASPRGREPARDEPPRASTPPVLRSLSLQGAVARDYDPSGSAGESRNRAPAVIDGDVAKTWVTEDYFPGDLGKRGVGVYVALPSPRRIDAVELVTPNIGADFEVYGAREGPPKEITDPGWRRVGARNAAPKRSRIQLTSRRRFRLYLVWVRDLPDKLTRLEIAEVRLLVPARR